MPFVVSPRAQTTRHVLAKKAFLIALIRCRPGNSILLFPRYAGSDHDAIEFIEADPRETFIIGDCDHHDAEGFCLGHSGEEMYGD